MGSSKVPGKNEGLDVLGTVKKEETILSTSVHSLKLSKAEVGIGTVVV